MQTVVYNLLFITAHTFMGSYTSLDNCNKAIRDIFTKEVVGVQEFVTKEQMSNSGIDKAIDTKVKYQREYVCVRS